MPASEARLELRENISIIVGKMTNQRLQDAFVSEHSTLDFSQIARLHTGRTTPRLGIRAAA